MLAHISKCKARAVIVVPKTRAAWFPMIEGAGVRSVQTKSQGAGSQFFKVHHQRGAEPYTFGRGGMRAVELDLGELYNSYKDNHAPRRDTQHPSTNNQMHTRTRRPITSRPSHRRISTRDAYTHKATSTRIATSHRRISTRGAHRLTVHDNNTDDRPAGSQQVTAESVHAAHIHTRRPVHASRESPPNQYTRSTSNETVHDNNTYAPPTGSHQYPATKNTDTCIRHPRQSLMFKMPRRILPSTSASGTRHRVRTAQRTAVLPCYA